MDEKRTTGRVTIPTNLDVVPETIEILKKKKKTTNQANPKSHRATQLK